MFFYGWSAFHCEWHDTLVDTDTVPNFQTGHIRTDYPMTVVDLWVFHVEPSSEMFRTQRTEEVLVRRSRFLLILIAIWYAKYEFEVLKHLETSSNHFTSWVPSQRDLHLGAAGLPDFRSGNEWKLGTSTWNPACQGIARSTGNDVMCLKQCHKPPIWEWFIAPMYLVIRRMVQKCKLLASYKWCLRYS